MWIVPKKSNNISNLIDYDYDKQDQDKSKIGGSNLPSTNKEAIIKTFNFLKEQAHKNVKQAFIVGNVSLGKDEFLNDEQLEDVLKAYMKKINLEGFPYLFTHHNDTKYKHAHFIISRINFDGATHNEKKVFFKRDAKQISNQYNAEYGFKIIDKKNLSIDDFSHQEYKELAIEKYQFGNALIRSSNNGEIVLPQPILDSIKSGDETHSLEELVEPFYNIGQLKVFLHEKGYFNSFYKKELIEKLKAIYLQSNSLKDYLLQVNSHTDLYARVITDVNKANIETKTLEYGIARDGENKIYFDQKALPEHFRYNNLMHINKIKNDNLKVYSYGQQKAVISRLLFNTRNASTTLDQFFNKIKKLPINLTIHKSGDKLVGYNLSLANVSSPQEFKSSQIHRQLTPDNLTKYFEDQNLSREHKFEDQTALDKEDYIPRENLTNLNVGNSTPKGSKSNSDDDNESKTNKRKKRKR